MKIPPSKTVKNSPQNASERFPSIKAWWAQVTLNPEPNKIAVFNSGIAKGLIGSIPVGGQTQPTSGLGLKELWKKAQKNPKKKRASDIIKSSIPARRPRDT